MNKPTLTQIETWKIENTMIRICLVQKDGLLEHLEIKQIKHIDNNINIPISTELAEILQAISGKIFNNDEA